jgi:hypothetical protein
MARLRVLLEVFVPEVHLKKVGTVAAAQYDR